MSEEYLVEYCQYLVELLNIEIDVDPYEPDLIIECFKIMFDQDKNIWKEIQEKVVETEEKWNAVIEFIQVKILEGQELQFQQLGLKQVLEIYALVIEIAENYKDQQLKMLQREEQQSKQNSFKKEEKNIKRHQDKKQKIKDKSKSKKKDNQIQLSQINKEKEKKSSLQKKQNKSSEKQVKQQKKVNIKTNEVIQKPKPQQKKIKKSIGVEKKKQEKRMKQEKPLEKQLIQEITEVMKQKINKRDQKTSDLMRDQKNNEAVKKTKRQFNHYLKQYQREAKLKHKYSKELEQKSKNKKQGGVDGYFLKVLAKKQKNISETIASEQLKYYLTLRDKKIAFINHVHKLTEKLEKERQIYLQKRNREIYTKQRQKMTKKMEQANHMFEQNIEALKENYQKHKENNELKRYNDLNICKQMQKQMKKKKFEEMDEMKVLWQQQNMKLKCIIGDEQKIKNKLIDIYRKNRV